MKKSLFATIALTGIFSSMFTSQALAYEKIGGRFTQDPLNQYYYNGTGSTVKVVDSSGTYYYSHWLEVGHAIDDWNNTQHTKVYFTATSDQSKSILDFTDTAFAAQDLYGQTSMWNGNTPLSIADTHTNYWYWAKVEINSSPSCWWRENTITLDSSSSIAVDKLHQAAAHEVGHALGLDHTSSISWNLDKLMYPNPDSYYENGIVGPTSDEISGVQDIYGYY